MIDFAEVDPDILFADGFAHALIGYVQQFNTVMALYDRAKCIRILMKRDGMTEEGAEEFFEFNVVGAWAGKNTPAFATFTPRIASAMARPPSSPRPKKSRSGKRKATSTRR